MSKTDLAIGIGFALLGAWTVSADQVWLGVALVILGALFLLTALSPRASAVLHGPFVRRK